MRPRISIKTLMVLVAAVAAACGWYVSQAAERNRELAAIARLGELAGVASVERPGECIFYCGQWRGVNVRMADHTPQWLRPLARYFGTEVCHRVDSVVFRGVAGTELIATLDEFSQLKSVSFYVDRLLSREEAEIFYHQLELYAALHPRIEVNYPSDIAEIYRPDPNDPFASPEFGMDARTALEKHTRASDGRHPLFSSDDLVADPFALGVLRDQAAQSTGVTREILQYAVTRLEEVEAER